ncbi:MAG: VOC family protein [Burkholderiaceae bacterium]|nr:VOC family protein [Microbacteriaceae bacterium]
MTGGSPGLVPELLVADLPASLGFWVGLCGFEVLYERPDQGFTYIRSGNAEVMLEQAGVGRNWLTGELHRPLGRGVNFQVSVVAVEPLLERLRRARWPLFMEPEDTEYLTGATVARVRQFLVQDPDGYLLRFSASLT